MNEKNRPKKYLTEAQRRFNVISDLLKMAKRAWAAKKAFRLVHFRQIPTKDLDLDGVVVAFEIKIRSGDRFKLGVVDSHSLRDDLLRVCKQRSQFIPLLVDTGYEKIEMLLDTLQNLLFQAFRHNKRRASKHPRVRTKRCTPAGQRAPFAFAN